MANILDYLDWRGDLTLAERGFNEVDNLLMAELCFLDFSGIVVPADFFRARSPEAMQKYRRGKAAGDDGRARAGADPGAGAQNGREPPFFRSDALRLCQPYR